MSICLYTQENYASSQVELLKALKLAPDNENYLELETNVKKKLKQAYSDR